jgi:DNA-binding transcriptional MocR family regulator
MAKQGLLLASMATLHDCSRHFSWSSIKNGLVHWLTLPQNLDESQITVAAVATVKVGQMGYYVK